MKQFLKTSLPVAAILSSFILSSCSNTKTSEETKETSILSATSSEVKTASLNSTEESIDKTVSAELTNTTSEVVEQEASSVVEDVTASLKTEETNLKESATTSLTKEVETKELELETKVEALKEETTAVLDKVKDDATEVVNETVEVVEPTFSHDKFNALLKKNVTYTGKVNYNGFKGNASFKEYLNELSSNEPQSSWSRNKKLAYWINVYNAFTIKLIIDNYPVKSIMDLHGGKPWDHKFIKIGSNTYSLNHVEHKIIRPVFKDPRIHFACVCAALSCPKLANKAYTESNVNSLLTIQTKYFINNANKNKIEENNLMVSQLFNWYAGDFGDVHKYIAKYSKTAFSPDAKIEFMTYDWSLNK